MGRTDAISRWLRRAGIEVLGWLLIMTGVLALVLPGPGLLTLAAGLVVLSLRYEWAKRLLIPIKARALMLAGRVLPSKTLSDVLESMRLECRTDGNARSRSRIWNSVQHAYGVVPVITRGRGITSRALRA